MIDVSTAATWCEETAAAAGRHPTTTTVSCIYLHPSGAFFTDARLGTRPVVHVRPDPDTPGAEPALTAAFDITHVTITVRLPGRRPRTVTWSLDDPTWQDLWAAALTATTAGASGYGQDNECVLCGAHLADPHSPSCPATDLDLDDDYDDDYDEDED